MKRCPECRRDYTDETLNFCLDDGAALVDGPASGSDRKTEIIDSPDSQRTGILTEGETQILRTHKTGGKNPTVAAVIAIGALLVAVGGYGLYRATRQDEPVRNVNVQTQRLSGDGRTRVPVISPDGKFLAYAKLEDGKQSLWIKQIVSGSTVNVVKPGESSRFDSITFSPDGNFVFFNARMPGDERPTIYKVPALGGAPVKFISDAGFLQFSKDGKSIAFRRSDLASVAESVVVANADGTNERVLSTRSAKQYFTTSPAWSPDGKQIATGIGDDNLGGTESNTVQLISVETGEQKEIGERRWDNVDEAVWHPSGDSLIVIASENVYLPGQVWELALPSGKYRRLTNDLYGHYALSITDDGKSIVTGELSAKSAVWVSSDLKVENAKQVMPSTGDTWGLGWTGDGRIAYISEQTGAAELWIMNADGTDARQLTNDRVFKMNPSGSADGKYIVYTSSQNGGELVRIDTSGANSRVLTKTIISDNAQFSRDGKWVIFSGYVEGMPRIMRVPIDGGTEQVISDRPAQEPRYSTDGSRFACFAINESTLLWTTLLIYPADGGSPIATMTVPDEINWGRGPVWTPDDKGIVLINASGERQDLWLQPVDGSPGRFMAQLSGPGIARREYSHDGKRIAVTRAEGIGNAILISDFR
jgi:Tol biopolymer transport system component